MVQNVRAGPLAGVEGPFILGPYERVIMKKVKAEKITISLGLCQRYTVREALENFIDYHQSEVDDASSVIALIDAKVKEQEEKTKTPARPSEIRFFNSADLIPPNCTRCNKPVAWNDGKPHDVIFDRKTGANFCDRLKCRAASDPAGDHYEAHFVNCKEKAS